MADDRPVDAFHAHEALHTTWVLLSTFTDHVTEHPYVKANSSLVHLAEQVEAGLNDLYQAIGAASVDLVKEHNAA